MRRKHWAGVATGGRSGSWRICPTAMSSCCAACSATAGRGPADVSLVVYLPLALPALFAPFAGPLSARLDPRHATWLLTGAAVVLRVPPVASFGHWSLRVLGRDTPAGIAVALLAMVLLSVAVLTVSGFVSRRCRALAGAYREARSLPGPGRTVVVADEAADAFALPGWPGRIVVTAGMLSALDEPGRAALLAHEQAHLAGFHYLFTTAARLAATASPLLRPVARAVEYTVERWADERAARRGLLRCPSACARRRWPGSPAGRRPARPAPAAAAGAAGGRAGPGRPGRHLRPGSGQRPAGPAVSCECPSLALTRRHLAGRPDEDQGSPCPRAPPPFRAGQARCRRAPQIRPGRPVLRRLAVPGGRCMPPGSPPRSAPTRSRPTWACTPPPGTARCLLSGSCSPSTTARKSSSSRCSARLPTASEASR